MFCWVYPDFHCSLPRVPMVLSQKAFCVEQTGSGLRISLQTPAGMPGEHPNTSQKQLFKWSRAARRGCVCSSLALWAPGPASSGTKPWAQMFALLAGSPNSSCLLIDDNLHNDTTHADAARHAEVWELPMPSLAGWPNSYLPASRQQRQQEPESVWSKDAHYNPSKFKHSGGRGKGLVYSLANLPRTLHTDAQHVHYTHILEYQSWMQLVKPWFMDKMDSAIKPVELPSRKYFLKRICFLMRPDFTQAQYLVYCQALGFAPLMLKKELWVKAACQNV